MSKAEFDKFNNGEVLINKTEHCAKTNSVGFCFFNLKDFTPEYISSSTSGIVNFEICAVFEVDKKYLKESWGIYHNSKYRATSLLEAVASFFDEKQKIKVTEWCTTKYDKKKFKLLRYSEDIWKQHFFSNKENFKWIEAQ